MKIMSFGEMSFTQADLELIGPETVAFLATLAYAQNELNTMHFLFIGCADPQSREPIVQARYRVMQNTIARIMNAKVFEVVSQLPKYRQRLSRAAPDQVSFFDKLAEELEQQSSKPGKEIAEYIRDKVTNHYLPSVTLDRIREVGVNRETKQYHHEMIGNSFYPFGEDFVFLAALEFLARERNVPTLEILETWMDWSLESSCMISDVLQNLQIKILEHKLSNTVLRMRKPYIDEDLCLDPERTRLPLFYQQ